MWDAASSFSFWLVGLTLKNSFNMRQPYSQAKPLRDLKYEKSASKLWLDIDTELIIWLDLIQVHKFSKCPFCSQIKYILRLLILYIIQDSSRLKLVMPFSAIH